MLVVILFCGEDHPVLHISRKLSMLVQLHHIELFSHKMGGPHTMLLLIESSFHHVIKSRFLADHSFVDILAGF